MADGVVIAGGGQAGSQLAASLREHGYEEPIHLVAAEAVLPYQRPPLSKAYLKENLQKERLLLRAETFYEQKRIELVLGTKVVRIDRRLREVQLEGGNSLKYAHLVLATGSRNRILAVPGAELEGIFYLRSLADAEQIKDYADKASTVVVIGGGFVGLELACVMHSLGKATVVIEALARPLTRVLSPPTAAHLAETHVASGISLHVDAKVTGFRGEHGRVTGVSVEGRPPVMADMVLVGIGALPDTELAAEAGLALSNGIQVNDHLTTSDPLINAIGDCAAFPGGRHGSRIRLESVQNAVDQARSLGSTLAGHPNTYDEVPWFWSDQGDCRLQIAGLTAGHDRAVIRGAPGSGRFSVFCYSEGRLMGVESINQSSDHMSARRLLKRNANLSPEQAADLSFDLKSFAQAAARSDPSQ